VKQSSATLNRLFKLIGPYRWWVVAGVLLSFATVGSSVGLMAMSAYLISKAAIVTEVVELSMAIAFVRTFAIARAGFRYVERVVTHRATFRILTYLRVWFYRSIEPLAPARLQQYRSGDLLTRIVADIETLENFYVRVVVPPLAAALVTVLACAILGIFDIWLGVALFIFLALTGVGLPLLSSKLSRLPAAVLTTARAELNAALVDEIQGAADLIAFGQELNQTARIERLQRTLTQAQERLALGRGLCDGLAALFTSLAGLTILCLAIPLVSDGKLNGVFLALLPLTAIASFEAVQPLTLAFQNLEASRAAAGRLFELIDTAPAFYDPGRPSPQPTDFSLEVRNLRFCYEPGEPPVLDGLSFCVPAGQCTALVGPSGAGKSSLVNLLQRFWDYQEGEIRLGGYELHEYQAEDVRRLLSVVSQQPHLFNSTLRDNLWLANPQASEETLWSACRQAQLETFIQSLPQGMDTLIGENGLLLSGGERQRLAIARALLKEAPILILDEATANLDAVTEQAVVQALESFRAGRTTLIIAHAPGNLGHVDQVIAMESGRVLT
jgi:ATP-binding cassette, subfamily C, bacterial CydC